MTTFDHRARLRLAVAAAAAGLFCAAAALAPLAERLGWEGAWLLRLAFRPTCHQIPNRCLDLGAGPMAVCARCAGLYLGGFLGLAATVAGLRLRPRLSWIAAVATPSLIDFGLGLAGLPKLPGWPRFAVAVPLGLLLGLLLGDVVAELGRPARPEPPGR